MNLKAIKNIFTSRIGRQILTAQKHSPALMFGAGMVGMVATVVLASRATLKLEEVLADTQKDLELAKTTIHEKYSEKDRTRDIAILYTRTVIKVAKLYAPAVIVGVMTVGALTGAHILLSRRNAALTAAYAALDRGFKEYRRRVINEVGSEKEEELRYGAQRREIVEETSEGAVVKQAKSFDPNVFSPYARFFDQLCPSWQKTPEYNFLFLRCQQNYANDMLRARGHVFLNEVYDLLGVERSKAGAVVGWVISKNGDNFVDFGIFNGNNDRAREFVNGREGAILLDFNVDGVIWDKI